MREAGEVALYCLNVDCPDQRWRSIQFFAHRGAMNIEGIGEVLAQELVQKGLVGDPADIFDLTVDRLAPPKDAPPETVRVERMARKSAENLVASIDKARTGRHAVAAAGGAGHPARRGGGGARGGPALRIAGRAGRRRAGGAAGAGGGASTASDR